jgi:hypothetical protein
MQPPHFAISARGGFVVVAGLSMGGPGDATLPMERPERPAGG